MKKKGCKNLRKEIDLIDGGWKALERRPKTRGRGLTREATQTGTQNHINPLEERSLRSDRQKGYVKALKRMRRRRLKRQAEEIIETSLEN